MVEDVVACADFIRESLLGLPHAALPGVVLAGQQRPWPWPFIVILVFHAPSPGVEPGTLTGIREAVSVVASHRWASWPTVFTDGQPKAF